MTSLKIKTGAALLILVFFVLRQMMFPVATFKNHQDIKSGQENDDPPKNETLIGSFKNHEIIKDDQENDGPQLKATTINVTLPPPLETTKTKSSPRPPPITAGSCYDVAQSDRSGSVISNMIESHAYAYSRNLTYGGACPPDKDVRKGGALQNFNMRRQGHEDLINVLGLKDELPFACPPNETNQHESSSKVEVCAFRMPITDPQWLAYIRGRVRRPTIETSSDQHSPTIQVAVHVRRGDINPWCVRKPCETAPRAVR